MKGRSCLLSNHEEAHKPSAVLQHDELLGQAKHVNHRYSWGVLSLCSPHGTVPIMHLVPPCHRPTLAVSRRFHDHP
jgi:hypothetical protein